MQSEEIAVYFGNKNLHKGKIDSLCERLAGVLSTKCRPTYYRKQFLLVLLRITFTFGNHGQSNLYLGNRYSIQIYSINVLCIFIFFLVYEFHFQNLFYPLFLTFLKIIYYILSIITITKIFVFSLFFFFVSFQTFYLIIPLSSSCFLRSSFTSSPSHFPSGLSQAAPSEGQR